MNYQKEIDLLWVQHQKTAAYVKGNKFCEVCVDEKIHHSLQVIGAGNYLMKHEAIFQNRSPEFLRCASVAYILHDIGRFGEIQAIYDHQKSGDVFVLDQSKYLDHGVYGSEILAKMPEYNDPRIIIPVRHHGHMIADFYADAEYQAIQDETVRREIEEIIFLVRDADKIANFYLNVSPLIEREYRALFFCPEAENQDSVINPVLLDYFKNHQVVLHKDKHSMADSLLSTMSWVFDLNFQTSVEFIKRFDIVNRLMKRVRSCNNQLELQEKLARYATDYLNALKLNQSDEVCLREVFNG